MRANIYRAGLRQRVRVGWDGGVILVDAPVDTCRKCGVSHVDLRELMAGKTATNSVADFFQERYLAPNSIMRTCSCDKKGSKLVWPEGKEAASG